MFGDPGSGDALVQRDVDVSCVENSPAREKNPLGSNVEESAASLGLSQPAKTSRGIAESSRGLAASGPHRRHAVKRHTQNDDVGIDGSDVENVRRLAKCRDPCVWQRS